MAREAPLADTIPGPFGPIHVAATERGVVALEWLVDGRASMGALDAVRPLEDGPDAFARLAAGPPPAAVKVFLAGAGREA